MENVLFGIVSGSIILLGAVGFSMTLKAENFVNVAHGQMLLVGAYLALFFNKLGVGLFPAGLLSTVITGVIGVVIYRFIYRPVKVKGNLVLLFSSVGVSYIIYGLIGMFFGKKIYSYDIDLSHAFKIGGTPLLTRVELAIVILASCFALSLHFFLTRTRIGKAIRAVADNQELSMVIGVNPLQTSNYVWFISSAMAGVSGIFFGIISSLHSEMGWNQIMIILSATVLGGLGSIYGVMLASLLLGLVMEMGILVLPSYYRTGIAFVVIIIVLLIRPEGLQSLWSKRTKILGR